MEALRCHSALRWCCISSYQKASTSEDNVGDVPCSPFVIAKGENFLTAGVFTICIDTHAVIESTTRCQAFKLMLFTHFSFTIEYRKEVSLTLVFTQRAAAALNPDRGSKVEKSRKQRRLTPQMTNLIKALRDYEC
ncbi:uncharacterized protein LOC125756642 [Rhipicephalus sanguineus]|uniref:uncharacterized protein LOC125756642 n=1 Tax=Rhipicephalus sanguineus TaxID=34632 RepID=UPI0020C49B9D|nr:uncharacterized protein LOC125756642 [Rhipicephalus sanguineus]